MKNDIIQKIKELTNDYSEDRDINHYRFKENRLVIINGVSILTHIISIFSNDTIAINYAKVTIDVGEIKDFRII